MTVTIKDIAKIAGVNHSTVSRSLNDSPLISEETKERIKKIALDMGFEFNANARGLSTKRTGTIALVYPEDFDDFNTNLFFSSIQRYVRKTVEKEDYDVIVTFPKNRFTGEDNIQKLVSRKKVDGLVIVHSDIADKDLKYLLKSEVPFVFLHNRPQSNLANKVDFFCTDHFKGGYLAAKHLLSLGKKRIACITMEDEEFIMRTAGYRAALLEGGIEYDSRLVFFGDCSFESAVDIINDNFELIKSMDAIFVQSDLMAYGAIEALNRKGILVPGNIAVVGYDDIELSDKFSPRLTTIHQPREEITEIACQKLIEQLKNGKNDEKCIEYILEPLLIIRESSVTNKQPGQ